LRREGVNVCLGTDSLASVYKPRAQAVELNLFEEMRVLANREPWLAPRAIVRMATVNSARALGLTGRAGELRAGGFADIIALPFSGKGSKVEEAVVGFQGKLAASMIDGRWAIPPV
jgi:5-methylthioadenosine/S-adenosylhomocysteine deaminase